MKELDLMLQGWLDRRYAQASGAEKASFARLLALPDPEIACYLFGHEVPDDPALATLVAELAPRGVRP